jgi:hypothetical protein
LRRVRWGLERQKCTLIAPVEPHGRQKANPPARFCHAIVLCSGTVHWFQLTVVSFYACLDILLSANEAAYCSLLSVSENLTGCFHRITAGSKSLLQSLVAQVLT